MLHRVKLFKKALLLSCLLVSLEGYAQKTARVAPRNIFEALEGDIPGEGVVVIEQSNAIRQLVGKTSSRLGRILGKEGNTTLLMGYRIQFYNGNLPVAKGEAEHRAGVVRNLTPEYPSYITYNAPFWRLVVGDFLTMEAARQARTQLLKVLPSWARESYIVRDKVRIINYKPNEPTY